MPKKRTKKVSKKPAPNKVDAKLELAKMLAAAKGERAKNKHLIAKVKDDPDLADTVKELMCEDLRRVFAIPREVLGPSASMKRYREHGYYSEAMATYLFGLWAEFKRQAKIEESLGIRTVKRNISKTLRAQTVADYADEHVRPWCGAYNSLDLDQESVLIMVGSDFHSKFLDPFARRVWLDLAEALKPDGIRFNGDLPDFPSISRHRQLPGHFALNLQQEIDLCTDFMRETREAAPDSDMKFLLGNHDIRLINAIADAFPVFSSLENLSFAELFKLDDLEIGLVSRPNFLNPSARFKKHDIAQNWETIANLFTLVHGFLCGKDAPRKHMARFMRYGTNGHLHDPMMVSGGSQATGVHQWWQTPCMAYPPALAADYLPGPIEYAGWAPGFALFRIFPRHGFVTGHQIIIGEVAEYAGITWEITDEERDLRERMLEI